MSSVRPAVAYRTMLAPSFQMPHDMDRRRAAHDVQVRPSKRDSALALAVVALMAGLLVILYAVVLSRLADLGTTPGAWIF